MRLQRVRPLEPHPAQVTEVRPVIRVDVLHVPDKLVLLAGRVLAVCTLVRLDEHAVHPALIAVDVRVAQHVALEQVLTVRLVVAVRTSMLLQLFRPAFAHLKLSILTNYIATSLSGLNKGFRSQ